MGTYNKEREELHKTIWSIAEELTHIAAAFGEKLKDS